ncbi:MAG: VanZ family protein [Anaerolineae bacterium]|nr:VanZ family protein [Anaerolineae bacterium]
MDRLNELPLAKPMRIVIALCWSALLTLLLLQGEADPVIDLGIPRGDNTPARELAFSTLHLLAFGVTTACWYWALSRSAKPRRALLAACLIAIALGVTTEILQAYTLDRHASWLDLAANIGGALLAARVIGRWLRSFPTFS